jgi:hypothetical protein
MIAQAIKRYAQRRVVEVVRRVVVGTEEAVDGRLKYTQHSLTALINTAYIERLEATFRSRLAPLVRRSRAAARQRATLEGGMWLVGTVYNFCRTHRSLRLVGSKAAERRWIERTPAQAAGLTDHRWSFYELLSFAVPRPLYPSGAETTEMVVGGCSCGLTTHPRLNGVLPLG